MRFVYGETQYEFEFESGKVKSVGRAQPLQGEIPPQLLAQMTEDQRIQFLEQRRSAAGAARPEPEPTATTGPEHPTEHATADHATADHATAGHPRPDTAGRRGGPASGCQLPQRFARPEEVRLRDEPQPLPRRRGGRGEGGATDEGRRRELQLRRRLRRRPGGTTRQPRQPTTEQPRRRQPRRRDRDRRGRTVRPSDHRHPNDRHPGHGDDGFTTQGTGTTGTTTQGTTTQGTQQRGGGAATAAAGLAAPSRAAAPAAVRPPKIRRSTPASPGRSDSKAFYVTRTDTRGIKDLYLVDSLAAPRPKLEQYKYPMPGEDAVRKSELHYCDVEKKTLTKIAPKWKDERYSDIRWDKTPGELRFIRRDRLQRNLEVCSFDVFTGRCKCLFGEGFEAAFLDMQPPRYLEESDEMIWWSERSGWGHFYLYGRDGKLQERHHQRAPGGPAASSTSMPRTAFVYLVGNGRETGENVYYKHLYRVKLDGTGLTCLDLMCTCQRRNPRLQGRCRRVQSHVVAVAVEEVRRRQQHGASITRRSRRSATTRGKIVMALETTDLSALEEDRLEDARDVRRQGRRRRDRPLRQHVEAVRLRPEEEVPDHRPRLPRPADGGRDVPLRRRSARPCSWPSSGSSSSRSATAAARPDRSKAYHSLRLLQPARLRPGGQEGRHRAARRPAPFIDIDRVGIYGHSGGGFMSAAAVLQKPYNEFFKAAVASARQPRQQHLQRQLVRAVPRPEGSRGRAREDAGDETTGTGTQTGSAAADRAAADRAWRRPRGMAGPRRPRRRGNTISKPRSRPLKPEFLNLIDAPSTRTIAVTRKEIESQDRRTEQAAGRPQGRRRSGPPSPTAR